MIRFIKLISFRGPLATKYVFLNNQPFQFIDVNSNESLYYSLFISVKKCCDNIDNPYVR